MLTCRFDYACVQAFARQRQDNGNEHSSALLVPGAALSRRLQGGLGVPRHRLRQRIWGKLVVLKYLLTGTRVQIPPSRRPGVSRHRHRQRIWVLSFSCFTGTKVQILTQLRNISTSPQATNLRSSSSKASKASTSKASKASTSKASKASKSEELTGFTCFTGTHILAYWYTSTNPDTWGAAAGGDHGSRVWLCRYSVYLLYWHKSTNTDALTCTKVQILTLRTHCRKGCQGYR